MKQTGILLLTGLVLAVLGAAAWWFLAGGDRGGPPAVEREEPPAIEREAADGKESADASSEPDYPVPEGESASTREDRASGEAASAAGASGDGDQTAALPPLGQSDSLARSVLRGLFGTGAIEDWLVDESIVERLVVTINSLDGPAIPLRFWPVHNIEGLPVVKGGDDGLRWSPANAERYKVPVAILEAADPRDVAEVYFRHYPLFRQAYASLGRHDAHFNDRLVEIVDHLLSGPRVEADFGVKQPKVLYEFADPDLEAESWGRKTLIRMGPDNAQRVRDWLRRFRRELVRGRGEAAETPSRD